MSELKPCPFCGFRMSYESLRAHPTNYLSVWCENCESEGPPKQMVEEAIEAWNRRCELK